MTPSHCIDPCRVTHDDTWHGARSCSATHLPSTPHITSRISVVGYGWVSTVMLADRTKLGAVGALNGACNWKCRSATVNRLRVKTKKNRKKT